MTARSGLAPQLARDAHEPHRTATPLELLFDLVFVVAVSLSSSALHHLETEGHPGQGIAGYLAVFFAIWWAWMNVTWFATAFDTDDLIHRFATFAQMGGALVIAAGAGPAMTHGDITWIVVGYAIMRLVSVAQWIRVAVRIPDYRRTAVRYAVGIVVVQTLWFVALATGAYGIGAWTLAPLIVLELCGPALAERANPTPWHPHHIAERFGLFTLILLGESILASASAVIEAIEEAHDPAPLIGLAAVTLTIVASMWWMYFARSMHGRLTGGLRRAMTFGYAHFFLFAAAGAFSAGIEVAVDLIDGATELPPVAARAMLAVPVAVFFAGVWLIDARASLRPSASIVIVLLVAVMLGSVAVPASAPIVAACAVAVVVVRQTGRARSGTMAEDDIPR